MLLFLLFAPHRWTVHLCSSNLPYGDWPVSHATDARRLYMLVLVLVEALRLYGAESREQAVQQNNNSFSPLRFQRFGLRFSRGYLAVLAISPVSYSCQGSIAPAPHNPTAQAAIRVGVHSSAAWPDQTLRFTWHFPGSGGFSRSARKLEKFFICETSHCRAFLNFLCTHVELSARR